jgi:hypothetical protein
MRTAVSSEMLPMGNFVRADEKAARVDYLDRFLELADRGAHRGASGGEKRAAQLAASIVDHVPGLDAQAVAGLIEFVRLAAYAPSTAREVLEH